MTPQIKIQPDWASSVRDSTEIGLEYEGPKDGVYSVRLLADGRTVISVDNVGDLNEIELIGYSLREHLSQGTPWLVGGVALVLPERSY